MSQRERWFPPQNDEPVMAPRRHSLLSGVVALAVAVAVLIVAGFGVATWLRTRWPSPPPPSNRCVATIGPDTAEITLEQARNASTIAAVGVSRGLVPRATSIALATALQESGLRNLDYGDRDSLGLFQQRPSQGWGTPEQVMDPVYAAGKFYDAMVKVPAWQNADIGDVAQAVQRSGYPDAYDKHVASAKLLASALTGETHAAWSCIAQQSSPAAPDTLVTRITEAFGPAVSVGPRQAATSLGPASVTLQAVGDGDIAWAVGAFAQSWSSQLGVTAVTVGGATWTASSAVLPGWVVPADGTTADPLSVTVTF